MPALEFEVRCERCNADLSEDTSVLAMKGYSTSLRVNVKPCAICLKNERDEGHEEGRDEGYDQGHEDGKKEGKKEGLDEGYEQCQEELKLLE